MRYLTGLASSLSAVKTAALGFLRPSPAARPAYDKGVRAEFGIDMSKCDFCGECAANCPGDCITLAGERAVCAALSRCIGCGECARACPESAISIQSGPARILGADGVVDSVWKKSANAASGSADG